MTQPSAASNRNSRECTRLISKECLSRSPDVIALQESPFPSWGDNTFEDYTSVGIQQSHCGYVDLLLRNELAGCHQSIELNSHLPSVAASIILPNKIQIAISSSHLAPFKDNFPTRAQQCNDLMTSLTNEFDNCILLGDFNMRAAEDEYVENLCGGWEDAWKGCGYDTSTKFSWNSFVK